jgi:hypothetical protein
MVAGQAEEPRVSGALTPASGTVQGPLCESPCAGVGMQLVGFRHPWLSAGCGEEN